MTGKINDPTKGNLPAKAKGFIVDLTQHPLFTGVLGVLALVNPYAGAAALALGEYAKAAIGRRGEVFTEALKEELTKTDREELDKEFLRREEFLDLALKALEATLKTRHDEKIKYYARILVRAATKQDRSSDDPEMYLSILSNLSEREIKLAGAIYHQQENEPAIDVGHERQARKERLKKDWADIPNRAGISKEEFPFLLKRLESSGLVLEMQGFFAPYATPQLCEISNIFRKLMRYIEDRNP